jgi:small subunit ribosomal protein S2
MTRGWLLATGFPGLKLSGSPHHRRAAESDFLVSAQSDLVKGLVDAGIHFGHPTARWNPKMGQYIHGKRGNVHIIDVRETVKGLLMAKRLITNSIAQGKDILFVGTKRQARGPVAEHAARAGMHFVTERWLGGTLTNFRTIRDRLKRLDQLDKLWENGTIDTYSKKMKSTLSRERTKISDNLSGIRKMEKLPGLMFIIDTRREHIAIKEARKMGVKTLALIDTDSDPDLVDLPIPGNDDAMRAIEIIVRELADAAIEGKSGRSVQAQKDGGEGPRGRSSRSRFKAEGDNPSAPLASPTTDAPAAEAPAADAAPVEAAAAEAPASA